MSDDPVTHGTCSWCGLPVDNISAPGIRIDRWSHNVAVITIGKKAHSIAMGLTSAEWVEKNKWTGLGYSAAASYHRSHKEAENKPAVPALKLDQSESIVDPETNEATTVEEGFVPPEQQEVISLETFYEAEQ